MIVDFFTSVLGVLVGVGILNLGAAAVGSDMRFGWHRK